MASGIGILVSLSEILGAGQSGETLASLVREALLIRVVVIRHDIFHRRVDVRCVMASEFEETIDRRWGIVSVWR